MDRLLKRVVKYKKGNAVWTLKIYKLVSGFYGVRGWENGKKRVVSSGNHQYIGLAKTRTGAIEDAIDSVKGFR